MQEKTMRLGDVFYEKDYALAYAYAINNGASITEIESDTFGRRFQITERYKPTEEDLINELRARREQECFTIINRGQLWYDTLTDEKLAELEEWYRAWLDVTETKVIPEKPSWLK